MDVIDVNQKTAAVAVVMTINKKFEISFFFNKLLQNGYSYMKIINIKL
jgi:hypothetical protein